MLDHDRNLQDKAPELIKTKEHLPENCQKLETLLALAKNDRYNVELNHDCLSRMMVLWDENQRNLDEQRALRYYASKQMNRILVLRTLGVFFVKSFFWPCYAAF